MSTSTIKAQQRPKLLWPQLYYLGSLGLAVGLLWSYLHLPEELSVQAWTLSVIFLTTLVLAITKAFETGVVAFIALSLTQATQCLTVEQAFSKFSHPVSWLILMAFFISKGIISSGLARRIAFSLAYRLGSTPLRLSYALMVAETLLAPFIPSNTARGAGLIYPIALSLSQELFPQHPEPKVGASPPLQQSPSTPAAFLLYNCFQANVITSALFLTAMAGNPMIASFSFSHGYALTWTTWFQNAVLPGLVCLSLTPYLHYRLLDKNSELLKSIDVKKISQQYHSLEKMTRSESLMLGTFMMLLTSWVFLGSVISPTAAALIAVSFLLANKVLCWDEIMQDKAAWTTFIWLTTLLMLSTQLKEHGVIDFVANYLTSLIPFTQPLLVLLFLILINFFSHYFFASLTSHATTVLPTFIAIGVSFDVPLPPLVLSLAFSTSLSAGLTHYGTGSAPIFFNAGYWSLKQWWILGFIHAVFCLAVFCLLGLPIWWS